jgi:hypothetical protein
VTYGAGCGMAGRRHLSHLTPSRPFPHQHKREPLGEHVDELHDVGVRLERGAVLDLAPQLADRGRDRAVFGPVVDHLQGGRGPLRGGAGEIQIQ